MVQGAPSDSLVVNIEVKAEKGTTMTITCPALCFRLAQCYLDKTKMGEGGVCRKSDDHRGETIYYTVAYSFQV